MNLADLQYLTASADAGNFARAAKAHGLHPSTISRRIGRLEDELGLTLFERGSFGIRLTGGGRSVMVHVRRASPISILYTRRDAADLSTRYFVVQSRAISRSNSQPNSISSSI
jgi:DNA-binding transcriptional LysR family regulator